MVFKVARSDRYAVRRAGPSSRYAGPAGPGSRYAGLAPAAGMPCVWPPPAAVRRVLGWSQG
jgi:hypothetical protein